MHLSPFFVLGFSAVLASAGMDRTSNVDWPRYLGDARASHFSKIDQITTANIDRLQMAWMWQGELDDSLDRTQIQCNPLIIDGVVYGTDARIDLIALDGATGVLKWRLDPYEGLEDTEGRGLNRGLAWWSSGSERRLLFGVGRYLIAVDPRTGGRIPSFGIDGRVDLKEGLGRNVEGLQLQANTPCVVVGDRIVIGMRVGEGPGPSAPGHIRAYDVRTGELAWRFNTIPWPGEFGYETWPEDAHLRVGGANAWAGMTVDENRGLIFCPIGSAAFDFWGGDRLGQNLFADCLLALDAETGRRVWHYQFVHHDIWDRDPPAPPNLVTLTIGGRQIDAVAQVTKSGHVFVFERETGEPLFPIEERPAPRSDLAGESAWETQPLPTKPAPFARQVFSADQISNISPETYREILNRFLSLKPHLPFGPPSQVGTIIFPGFDGGAEWGGAAVDPDGILYVNANEMPWVLTMVDASRASSEGEGLFLQNCAGCHGVDRTGIPSQNIPSLRSVNERLSRGEILERIRHGKGVMPAFGFFEDQDREALADYLLSVEIGEQERKGNELATVESPQRRPYTHTGYRRWLDSNGYPAVKPPWGTLNAIDLNTGERVWTTTLGEFPELTARGIPPTGTENYGGPIVTSGGVLFIGASKDEHFRAFDVKTGGEIWKTRLPAGGYATPATYMIDGRQYVVIACGGGKMGTKSGNVYVAFALSEAP